MGLFRLVVSVVVTVFLAAACGAGGTEDTALASSTTTLTPVVSTVVASPSVESPDLEFVLGRSDADTPGQRRVEEAAFFRLNLVNQTGQQHLSLSDYAEIRDSACGGAVDDPEALVELSRRWGLGGFSSDAAAAGAIWSAARNTCPENFADQDFANRRPTFSGAGGGEARSESSTEPPDAELTSFVDVSRFTNPEWRWSETQLTMIAVTEMSPGETIDVLSSSFGGSWSIGEVLGPVVDVSGGFPYWTLDLFSDDRSGVVDVIETDTNTIVFLVVADRSYPLPDVSATEQSNTSQPDTTLPAVEPQPTPTLPCLTSLGGDWYDVRVLAGDVDGDGSADQIETATRTESTDSFISRTFTLCVKLSSGSDYHVEFFSFLGTGAGGTRPVGSIPLGGRGDTILVTHGTGASVTYLQPFALVAGDLVPLGGLDEDIGFVVGGSITHGDAATCSGEGDEQQLVLRSARIVHPIPEDYDEAILDLTETSYIREGAALVEVGVSVDQTRYGQWADARDWWDLRGCPNTETLTEGTPDGDAYGLTDTDRECVNSFLHAFSRDERINTGTGSASGWGAFQNADEWEGRTPVCWVHLDRGTSCQTFMFDIEGRRAAPRWIESGPPLQRTCTQDHNGQTFTIAIE